MPILVLLVLSFSQVSAVNEGKGHSRWFSDAEQEDGNSPDEVAFDVTNHGKFIRRKDFANAERQNSEDAERAALLERASHVFEQLRHHRSEDFEAPRRKERPHEGLRRHRSHSKSHHHHHSLIASHARQHSRAEAAMMSGRSSTILDTDKDTTDPDAPGAPEVDARPDAEPNLSQEELDDIVKQDNPASADEDEAGSENTQASENSEKSSEADGDTSEASENSDKKSDVEQAGSENTDASASSDKNSEMEQDADGKTPKAQDTKEKETVGSKGGSDEASASSNLRASKAVGAGDDGLSSSSSANVVANIRENQATLAKIQGQISALSKQDGHRTSDKSSSGTSKATKTAEKAAQQHVEIVKKRQSEDDDSSAGKTEDQASVIQGTPLSPMGEEFASSFGALGTIGLITFALTAACALPFRHEPQNTEETYLPLLAWLPKHSGIQAVSFGWTLITTAQCVLMMPEASGLPWHAAYMPDALQGHGVLMSSLLLMLFSSEGARRLMRPWCQTQNRTVVLSLIAIQFVVVLIFSAAGDISDPLRLGESLQNTLLVMSRLAFGVCLGFANLLLTMAVKVTPSEAMMQFTVSRSGAMCLGAGIGAFVSASAESPSSLVARTLPLVCLPLGSLGVLAALVIPEDLAPLLTKLAASEDSQDALRASLKATQTEDEAVIIASRKKVWLLAAMAIFARTLLTSAFQFTTANILASELLFSGTEVLLFVGASFSCGAFVMPLVVLVKRARRSVDIGRVCVIAVSCTVFATMVLVRYLAERSAHGVYGMWLLFSVNAAALPAISLVGGIMESYGLQQSLALQQVIGDSGFSQENLILLSFLMQECVSRFLVPTVVLGLIFYGGPALSALALSIVASLVCIATFCARGTLLGISSPVAQDGDIAPAGSAKVVGANA